MVLAVSVMAVFGFCVSSTVTSAEVRASDRIFVVSPTGNDSAAGTVRAPFKSLERARAAVRQALGDRRVGGVEVYVRGGFYRRTQPLTLDRRDSGSPGKPVTWSAYPGEKPVISGGVALPAADFHPVSDAAVLARLKPAVRTQVRQVDLAALGVTNFGPGIQQVGFRLPSLPPPPEFFVDGVAQTIARYPNKGSVLTGAIISQADPPPNVVYDNSGGNAGLVAAAMATPETFVYTDTEPTTWASIDNVWMQGHFYYDWADGNLAIASIDPADKTITTKSSSFYGIRSGQGYYYYNVLEELDSPGEYYLDTTAAKLYYLPPAGFSGTAELSVLDAPLITLRDASNITFRGLTVQDGRSDGITVLNSNHIDFDRMSINRIGGSGIVFGLRVGDRPGITTSNEGTEGGYDNSVTRTTITGTGHGGIFLGGGDRGTLCAGDNRVTDSDISDMGRLQQAGSPAVEMAGVGNIVSHNDIHDGPNNGIVLHGNDQLVSYNVIARVMRKTGDGGAVYLGRDFSEAGNVVEDNYIHDIGNANSSGPKVGVYLDDQASGLTVRENIIENVDWGVLLGGGRQNVIDRNVFAGSGRYWAHIDSRGFSSGWTSPPTRGSNAAQMVGELAAIPYQDHVWAARYPWLSTVLKDNPAAPIDTRLTRNVVGSAAGALSVDAGASPYVTQSGNSVVVLAGLWPIVRTKALWAQGILRAVGPR